MATYACDDRFVLGLTLGGTVTRTCVDDDAVKKFDGQAPICVRKFYLFSNYYISLLHGDWPFYFNLNHSLDPLTQVM